MFLGTRGNKLHVVEKNRGFPIESRLTQYRFSLEEKKRLRGKKKKSQREKRARKMRHKQIEIESGWGLHGPDDEERKKHPPMLEKKKNAGPMYGERKKIIEGADYSGQPGAG